MSIHTDIGYATVRDIFVRNRNLATDIIPNVDFAEMVCLCILGQTPEANFKRMINLLLVTSCDHGFTPSTISGRLTYLGAPESLQGAVAAGLLGAGDRYLGATQNVAEMLTAWSKGLSPEAAPAEFSDRARELLQCFRNEKRRIQGVGHPVHVEGDPRVAALRRISKENGYYRSCWRLLDAIEAVQASEFERKLPINGAGAMGAIAADLGLDPSIARGLALVGRTAGLVGHIVEEATQPSGPAIWSLVLAEEAKGL